MEKYMLGLCVVLLIGVVHIVTSDDVRPEVLMYEEAVLQEMERLKASGDYKKDGAMSEAMDSVKHLKPDMEPTELIGMMGRVMQKTMGLNIQIQDPNKMAQDHKKEKETKKDKTKKKKKKDKKRKGPSLSNTGEL